MHAILLNIHHGGGRRAQGLLEWVTSHSPDVIVMPEWQNDEPSGLIKRGLEALGFYVATTALSRARSNGVLVAAKDAFQSRRVTPAGSERGELLLVDVTAGWRLLAAYFPQGNAKRAFFKAAIGEIACSDAVPFLLLGDLNTGHNGADVEGNGVPFSCANMFEALQTRSGLVDLWRAEHGEKQEWSWRSPKNGFRVDHALANLAFRKGFAAIRCYYDHSPREIRLTDHSALIVNARRNGPTHRVID